MMRKIKYKGPVLATIGCVVIVGVLGFGVSAAAAGTASKGNFTACDGKVHFESADVAYLCREVDLLQSELDETVFGEPSAVGSVSASTGKLRDLLNSRGTINYENGLVEVDANDLFRLADQTDGLGNSYTTMIYRALVSIGTYFDQEGNVGHEAQAAGSPTHLSREQLVSGIVQSQSVGHLAASPIIPDNLTAGTAAWVNGQYVIGNGLDNENAYRRGLEDGQEGNGDDIDVRYTYHEHIGNEKTGWSDNHVFHQTGKPGGCFTKAYHEHDDCPSAIGNVRLVSYHNYTDGCDWHAWMDEIAWQHACIVCNEEHRYSVAASSITDWETDVDFRACGVKHTHYTCADLPLNRWKVGCGKKTGQIETVTVVIRGNQE